jgi:choline dehydrogenase-like flavoprotein
VHSRSGEEFDAIVVGSGPGGATVARDLSRRGQRVLILERGRNAPIRGIATQAIFDLAFPGRGLAVTPELLAVTRGITTGGSAKIGDVVDSNLATEIDGLFVCDCSVIPEAWGLPPTLTILALARRLARQLSDGVVNGAQGTSDFAADQESCLDKQICR